MLLRDTLAMEMTNSQARIFEYLCCLRRNSFKHKLTEVHFTHGQIAEKLNISVKTVQRAIAKFKNLGLIVIEKGRHLFQKQVSNCIKIVLFNFKNLGEKSVVALHKFFGTNSDKMSELTRTKCPSSTCTNKKEKLESISKQSLLRKKRKDVSQILEGKSPKEIQEKLNEDRKTTKTEQIKPQIVLQRMIKEFRAENFTGELGSLTGANIGKTKTIIKRAKEGGVPLQDIETVLLEIIRNWGRFRRFMKKSHNERLHIAPNMMELTYHAIHFNEYCNNCKKQEEESGVLELEITGSIFDVPLERK